MVKTKVKYIDAFVLVVPKKKVAKYKKMSKEAGEVWMKHGALSYKECMGEELAPDMKGYAFLPFPKLVNLKAGETVWFSYIEYKSKAHPQPGKQKSDERDGSIRKRRSRPYEQHAL